MADRPPSRDCRMTGAAGEHYVLCQLLRHGYIAAAAPEGVAGMDIIASDPHGRRLFSIQVKARNAIGTDGGWHMKKKHEMALPDLFYCFVDLGQHATDPINCYVISGTKVAEVIRHSHMIWANGTGMRGQVRKRDGEMRRLLPTYETPLMMRPEITSDNRSWLANHGSGWMKPYEQAWPLLAKAPISKP